MIMVIILVFFVSIYMMVAGHMKKDNTAIFWGRIISVCTAVMLGILWFTKYR